jgi:glycosyltransferase involved in cell wall biosynthesis
MNIYVLCPDHDQPSGGIKKLYRHVDVLNGHGFSAYVLHQARGFRCTWFANRTRVAYVPDVIRAIMRDKASYLVIPEIYGPEIADFAPGVKKVMFNQSGYYTFAGYSLDKRATESPYLDRDVVAALVVSEDTRAYLRYAFPHLPITRIHNGVDPALFAYSARKRRQIAFMTDKNAEDVAQVINLLKFRGALRSFDLVPIAGKSEAQVGRILRDALIYLSFSPQEGFGMAAAEAMACGCIAIGYDGFGGREFFTPDLAYPVPPRDVLAFAQAVERVLDLHASQPATLAAQAARAAQFIAASYPPAQEERDIAGFWSRMRDSSQT